MMRLVAARLAQILGVHFLEQRVLVALADGLRVILAVQGCGAQGLQVRNCLLYTSSPCTRPRSQDGRACNTAG